MTDLNEVIVNITRPNIEINKGQSECLEMDWEKRDNIEKVVNTINDRVDLIIASDVIYKES